MLAAGEADPFYLLRQQMVDTEIVAAGITNPRVIEVMRKTPRHEFMPFVQRRLAYFDMAVPIGSSQTISPPYVVAFMTEQLDPKSTDRVLEIGAGSGYQAAVLGGLVKEVYTIEIVEPLGRRAARTLHRLGYENVHVKVGDGFLGWPKYAPFDKVIVTCSPEDVPQPLVEQLAEGGRMVIPLGERHQQALVLLRKEGGKLLREPLQPTLFVPMTGEAEERRQVLPDPLKPQIHNGGFEATMPKGKLPEGWHYVRQAEVVEASAEAPLGRRYVRFQNQEPGRGSRALQGFAVDGGQIHTLMLRMQARGEGVRAGAGQEDRPGLLVTFYDKRRGLAGSGRVEAPLGAYDWTSVEGRVRVPLSATEAILWVGLHGATGELEVDGVAVEALGPSNR